MSDFKANYAALKIQFALKLNNCIKKLEKFQKLKLYEISTKLSFTDFKKIIVKKDLLEITKKLCTSLELFKKGLKINPKILITAYLIKTYTVELIGEELHRHPIDNNIIFIASYLVNILETNKINDLWFVLREFKIIFDNWANIDKDRTIEKLIVSYYYRSEHINKIKSDQQIANESQQTTNDDQQIAMLEELERQRNDIIKSIKLIDKKFDINYLQENYIKIFNDIHFGWEQLKVSLTNTMKKAYYDMLSDDISNGNLLSCFALIKEIGKRLTILCPQNVAKSFSAKFSDDNLINVLVSTEYTHELIKFISFIIDSIIIMDAPDNDEVNKQWKLEISELIKIDFNKSFPQILIQIEEHIDIIYKLIIKLI